MFIGAHFLLQSPKADEDRAFIRDVLKFSHVDAGHGWLIFRLPPSELAVHPAETHLAAHDAGTDMMAGVLYFMCENLEATMAELAGRGVKCAAVSEERWGIRTSFKLPGGASLGLYQPKHPVAITT